MGRILDVLRQHPLFEGLSEGDLAALAMECRLRTPPRGERIFSAGEEAEAFYVVAGGAVKLSKATAAGKEHVVEVIHPGEAFALVSVLDSGRYRATATALAPSTLVRVPREAFRRLLADDPRVQERAAHEIAARLRRLQERYEELATRGVPARVAAHLLRQADEAPGGARQGAVVDLGAPREVVARLLGTAREVLSRTLHGLEREKVLALRGQRVEIIDPARLRERAGV